MATISKISQLLETGTNEVFSTQSFDYGSTTVEKVTILYLNAVHDNCLQPIKL